MLNIDYIVKEIDVLDFLKDNCFKHYDSNLAVYSDAPFLVYNDLSSDFIDGVAISHEYGNSNLNSFESQNFKVIKEQIKELAPFEMVVIPSRHGVDIDGFTYYRKLNDGNFSVSWINFWGEQLSPEGMKTFFIGLLNED